MGFFLCIYIDIFLIAVWSV